MATVSVNRQTAAGAWKVSLVYTIKKRTLAVTASVRCDGAVSCPEIGLQI